MSKKHTNNGLAIPKPFIQIPYQLFDNKEFLDLEGMSVKVYFVLLRGWFAHKPKEPVEMSYDEI